MNESNFERKCATYATAHGWRNYKLNGPGSRGKPDRMFMRKGRTLFVEFKAPGGAGRLSALQRAEIATLRNNGFAAEVVDDFEIFKQVLNNE